MFHSSYLAIDPKFIQKFECKEYSELSNAIFTDIGLGKNLMLRESNKYLFQLLQIFGYRDEVMLSLFDKTKMKIELISGLQNGTYTMSTAAEHFVVKKALERLQAFRSKVQSSNDFRMILLQTTT